MPPPAPNGHGAIVPPLLLAAAAAAAACSLSKSSWWRLYSGGHTPAAVKLGGRTLWRREDLELWTRAGCPDRKEFEALKLRNGH
jgi:predicted DNA-binding transcriptional regulator AlpA